MLLPERECCIVCGETGTDKRTLHMYVVTCNDKAQRIHGPTAYDWTLFWSMVSS